MTHALKTWPEFYKDVASGKKTFELRKFDRPFRTGDTVILQEWDPGDSDYTGQESTFTIGYILFNVGLGLQDGYCIFTLEPIS